MSAPAQVFYHVRLPGGGITNASSYASARIIAQMIPGSQVEFSFSSKYLDFTKS